MTWAIHRQWRKVRNIRHHMHYTLANSLLDNYERILLPSSGTSKMLQRKQTIWKKGRTWYADVGTLRIPTATFVESKAERKKRRRNDHIWSKNNDDVRIMWSFRPEFGWFQALPMSKVRLVIDRDLNAARKPGTWAYAVLPLLKIQ